MTDQPTLFPDDHTVNPPDRCPDCGAKVERLTFLTAECVSCPYTWRRDSQLHPSEPWPEGF